MMIEINLLPETLKARRKHFQIPQVPVIPIAGALTAVLVLLYFGLMFLTVQRSMHLRTLETAWEKEQPLHEDIQILESEVRELRAQRRLLSRVKGEGVLWARILNALSDHVPEGIQLTHLSLKQSVRPERLQIRGLAGAVAGKADMDTITLFVTALRKEAVFRNVFEEVELGGIERIEENGRRAARFTLTIPLRKREG